MHMFSYEAEAHCLHENRKDPGYRIGNKQETQRPVCREKSEDPHNPGSYGTDNRKNHRYSGISHSPEGSREQIHNTTTEIWYCSKGKDFHATADYICITGVDLFYPSHPRRPLWNKRVWQEQEGWRGTHVPIWRRNRCQGACISLPKPLWQVVSTKLQ